MTDQSFTIDPNKEHDRRKTMSDEEKEQAKENLILAFDDYFIEVYQSPETYEGVYFFFEPKTYTAFKITNAEDLPDPLSKEYQDAERECKHIYYADIKCPKLKTMIGVIGHEELVINE